MLSKQSLCLDINITFVLQRNASSYTQVLLGGDKGRVMCVAFRNDVPRGVRSAVRCAGKLKR